MNLTVERFYCSEKGFENEDKRFLVQETIGFCQQNNPLFLARPDWMVSATCISSHIYCFGYLLTLFLIWTKTWRTYAIPIVLFIGAKLNAILFYHYMEFTSSTPPKNLIAYFSVEGPYLVSMVMVIYAVHNSLELSVQKKKK